MINNASLKFACATTKPMRWDFCITRIISVTLKLVAPSCFELRAAVIGGWRNWLYFVVAKIEVRYRRPARYDDLLTLKTEISRVTPAKLEHHYCLMRESEVLTEANSIIACVNRAGEVQRIPEDLVGMTTLKDHL